ncbi:MAG: hypothetical protein HFE26_00600 [Clostridia bacterium]|nr:hypothetical protein [Clostridia bacterium]
MARDALYEESARSQRESSEAKMYTVFYVLEIIFLTAAVIQLLIFFTIQLPYVIGYTPEEGKPPIAWTERLIGALINLIPIVCCLAGWFLFHRFKRRYNASFDYLFVEDELRITKVFNNKRRKHLVKLQADKILQIGYCDKESFLRVTGGMDRRSVKYMTPNREPSEEKLFLYILYSSPVGKTVYVIECREKMLEYLVLAAGRNKFERQ